MAERRELNINELDTVNGGAYVTTSMTVGQIIETDRNLMKILAKAGIPTGSKSVRGQSLYEVAQTHGVDANALEDKMNDYLSSK